MDNPKPGHKPTQLLHDLESIRSLLGEEDTDPPLLTDSIDPQSIPLLSDIVRAEPPPAPEPAESGTSTEPVRPAPATASPLHAQVEQAGRRSTDNLRRLDSELRAAAELILQDVIDDFVPQIEAELKRRLEARLSRLLPPRRN